MFILYFKSSPRKKKKKLKTSIGEAVEKLDLIAMGTLSGDVMLYSVIKGDLHTRMVSVGHMCIKYSLFNWNNLFDHC